MSNISVDYEDTGVDSPYDLGWRAGYNRDYICPFHFTSEDFEEWQLGWEKGAKDRHGIID